MLEMEEKGKWEEKMIEGMRGMVKLGNEWGEKEEEWGKAECVEEQRGDSAEKREEMVSKGIRTRKVRELTVISSNRLLSIPHSL